MTSSALYEEVTATLRKAGREDLAERLLAEVKQIEVLTSSQAAEMLGVSSPNTVKNWLEDGLFPGAFRTKGGHWRFLRSEVERVRARMESLHRKNERGDLAPPDVEDTQEPPLL